MPSAKAANPKKSKDGGCAAFFSGSKSVTARKMKPTIGRLK